MAEDKKIDQGEEETEDLEDNLLIDGFSVVDSVNVVMESENGEEAKKVVEENLKEEAPTSNGEKKPEEPVPNGAKPAEKEEDKIKPAEDDLVEVKKEPLVDGKEDKKEGGTDSKEESEKVVEDSSIAVEPKDDSLIISTEEDLENDLLNKSVDTAEKDSKPAPENVQVEESDSKNKSKSSKKQGETNYVWVSNITRNIKATDLKKHFSEQGKVVTAKIVTNGKSLFGYVLMESAELANKCIQNLHNTVFEGAKISVTSQRPDTRRIRANTVERKGVKTSRAQAKKTDKTSTKPKNKTDVPDPLTKKYEPGDGKQQESATNNENKKKEKSEEDLRKEIKLLRDEFNRMRRRSMDQQRRLDHSLEKCRTYERELRDLRKMNQQLKNDRRKFLHEKEIVEKKFKLDQVRYEADRTILKKELEEVRRMRDHLKMKLESRPPMERIRKSRSHSPRARMNNANRYRQEEEVKRKWPAERTRTPPPPPKLTDGGSSRKRQAEMHLYYDDKKVRKSPPSAYGFDEGRGRHRSSFAQETKQVPSMVSRTGWPPQQQHGSGGWRPSPAAPSQTYPNERYSAYPSQTSFPVHSRENNFYHPSQEYPKHSYDSSRKY